MIKKIFIALILSSFALVNLQASAKNIKKKEKLPPPSVHKVILNIPQFMASEATAIFVSFIPIANVMSFANWQISSAENLYENYKKEQTVKEFVEKYPKKTEEFKKTLIQAGIETYFINNNTFSDYNPDIETIDYKIEYLKKLPKKQLTKKGYHSYDLGRLVAKINKENFDFYATVLNDDFYDELISPKYGFNSYKAGFLMLNVDSEEKYKCAKVLLRSGFFQEHYRYLERDFLRYYNNGDFSFLIDESKRKEYLKYTSLYSGRYHYNFQDNYDTFLLLKENGFSDDDIKKVLNNNYTSKLDIAKKVLENSKIPNDKKADKIVKKINSKAKKENINFVDFIYDAKDATFIVAPPVYGMLTAAEDNWEYLKFESYVAKEEKAKKKKVKKKKGKISD